MITPFILCQLLILLVPLCDGLIDTDWNTLNRDVILRFFPSKAYDSKVNIKSNDICVI